MTRQNSTELICAYLNAFNRSDCDGMLRLLSQDVAHDINQGERQIGRDKFRWFNAVMSEHYSEELGDIVVMVNEDGRHGAAEFTVRGRYLKTVEGLPRAVGQSYSLAAGIFFEIDDGMITRVSTSYNLQDWIRQVRGDA